MSEQSDEVYIFSMYTDWKKVVVEEFPESSRIGVNQSKFCEDFEENLKQRLVNFNKDELPENERYSIGVFGDSSVGKSSLVRRFYDGEYDEHSTKPTLGIELKNFVYAISGIDIPVFMVDCAGGSNNQPIFQDHFKRTDVALICFECDSYVSLSNVRYWYNEIVSKNNDKGKLKVFVVGCKYDKNLGTIQENEIEEICEEINAEFFPTSSLTCKGISCLFYRVAYILLERSLGLLPEVERSPLVEGHLSVNIDVQCLITPKKEREKKERDIGCTDRLFSFFSL